MSEATLAPCPSMIREITEVGWHRLKLRWASKVSHISKKTERYRFGPSIGVPLNWDCCTIDIRASFSLKLLASTIGLAMLDAKPRTPGVMKSWSIHRWAAPPRAILGEVCWGLSLWSSNQSFFLLEQKVLSISGSSSKGKGLRKKGKRPTKNLHKHYQHK